MHITIRKSGFLKKRNNDSGSTNKSNDSANESASTNKSNDSDINGNPKLLILLILFDYLFR